MRILTDEKGLIKLEPEQSVDLPSMGISIKHAIGEDEGIEGTYLKIMPFVLEDKNKPEREEEVNQVVEDSKLNLEREKIKKEKI